MAKTAVKRTAQNLAMIVGILLPTTLFLYRFAVPLVNRWAMTDSHDHTAADIARAYAVRLPLLLGIYLFAGGACILLVDSPKTLRWALLTVFLAILFGLLFQSVSLSGRIPFRQEIELQLPIFVPLVGVSLGGALAWWSMRRRREAI